MSPFVKTTKIFVLVSGFIFSMLAPATASDLNFKIIVNVGNPQNSISLKTVSDIFLKKISLWPFNEVARPVDLPSQSIVRQAFSQHVLKRSVIQAKIYWQQRIFSGRDTPPIELKSEAQVVEYVRKHHGAIGYVSSQTDTAGVRVISLK